MATISRRGKRWSVQIRRKGSPSQSKSFDTKAEAKAWASIQEGLIERGEVVPTKTAIGKATLGELLLRYESEVTRTKRGKDTEEPRLRKMRKDAICQISLGKLNAADLAGYRDRRLREVKPATVHRELALISHALDIGAKEWQMGPAHNPAKDVRKPSANASRTRRLADGEYDRLVDAARDSRNDEFVLAMEIAIETGLRRGELLGMDWQDVDLKRRLAHIPVTKTGVPRTIPLTDKALTLLSGRKVKTGAVFTITANALRQGWVRLVRRAGIKNLRFHDLRHEAISRFFELGLSVPEVALISGHRDPTMLMRYTHMRASDLAMRLRGKAWSERSA